MKIEIKGAIVPDEDQKVYDHCGVLATSPQKVSKLINQAKRGEPLEIIINSGGGCVFSGSEIYTMLKDYQGEVIIKIVGIAGSAASVIAMGGTKVLVSPTAQVMIHNSSCGTHGDHRAHSHTAKILKGIDESISNAYKLKTGLSSEKLIELMHEESWMSAQKALSLKFVDGIMFDETKVLNTFYSEHMFLSKETIDELKNNTEITDKKTKIEVAKAKLMAKLM